MTASPDGQGLALADEIEPQLDPTKPWNTVRLGFYQWRIILAALRASPREQTDGAGREELERKLNDQ